MDFIGNDTLLLPVLVVGLCSYILYRYMTNTKNPLPGPYGPPFFGYGYYIYPYTPKSSSQIKKLCRYYNSDIIGITSFGFSAVYIDSYDLVKELFVKRVDAADRYDITMLALFDKNYTGLLSTSGQIWKDVRRFTLQMMRDFGMGRTKGETRIQEESRILLEQFRQHNGKPFDPRRLLNMAVSNIICGIVFGKRFEYDDPKFLRALEQMEFLMAHLFEPRFFLMVTMPVLKYVFRNDYLELYQSYKDVIDFVREQINEHKKVFSGDVHDLIDGFLKEMGADHNPDTFNESMLESLIMDLFFAGSETTFTTLSWCMLLMAEHPDIQAKVREELVNVTGAQDISMSDKTRTPYTEAVLNELQRYRTLTPLAPDHSNLAADIELNGYTIPKKSLIEANLESIHRDPKVWKNPENFDPDNFLEDGKIINAEKLIQFMIGRRSCAGESLARMELYIFFSHIIKDFEIKLGTDDCRADLDGNIAGVIHKPKPFKIRMIRQDQ